MNPLEQIGQKRQEFKAQADKKLDTDGLLNALKEVQIAAYLGGQNKPPVILADSTDLGERLAELGEKITRVLEEFKSDTTATDRLNQISDDFKRVVLSVTKLSSDQSDKVQRELGQISKDIRAIKMPELPKMPDIPVPVVKIQERKLDLSPLERAIRESAPKTADLPPEKLDMDSFRAQDIASPDSNTQYIGFLNPAGEWYIIENKIKDNTLRYVFGKGGYSKAFAKAGTYQYELLSEAVNAL